MRIIITIIIYLLAIAGAEVVTLLNPLRGLGFHIAILVVSILHAALDSGLPSRHRQLVLSLALVPMVRIISLSLPLASVPQILWYPLVYSPLIAAAFVVMRIVGYSPRDIGLNLKLSPFQMLVAASGFALGILEYLILQPEPLVPGLTLQGIWLPALIFLVFVGFGEELIFRGVLQRTGEDAFGAWGIVYVGFLFAILHMGFLSWLDVVFVFSVALFFSWVVKKTGSLTGVTLSHGLTNTVLYLIAPFFFR